MKLNFWNRFDALSPDERLKKSLQCVLQSGLLNRLQEERGKGRNDYPIKTLFTALLKSLTHTFASIEALRAATSDPLPPPHAFSRFFHLLATRRSLLDEALQALVERQQWGDTLLFVHIPLGAYRLHALLSKEACVPLCTKITEGTVLPKEGILDLLRTLSTTHPNLLKKFRYALGERAYDHTELIETVYGRYHLKPVFALSPSPARNIPLCPQKNALYNELGEVFCIRPGCNERIPMSFAGFEEKRGSLKYRCYAENYGSSCPTDPRCTAKKGVRIPLKTDPRLFTPVARTSYKWQALFQHLRAKEPYEAFVQRILAPKIPHLRSPHTLSIYANLTTLLLLSVKNEVDK